MTAAERMARIETSIEYIKQILDENTKKLDENTDKLYKFIESADVKYATKLELEKISQEVKDHQKNSQGWIKSLVPWAISALSLFILVYVTFFK